MNTTTRASLAVAVFLAACAESATAPPSLQRVDSPPARYTTTETQVSSPPASYPTPEELAAINASVTGTTWFDASDMKRALTKTTFTYRDVERFTSNAELTLTKPSKSPITVPKSFDFVNRPGLPATSEGTNETDPYTRPTATATESCGWISSYRNVFQAHSKTYENRSGTWWEITYKVSGTNNANPAMQPECTSPEQEETCDDPYTFGTEETCEEAQQAGDWASPAVTNQGSAETFEETSTALVPVRIWWRKTYNRYGMLIAFDILWIEYL